MRKQALIIILLLPAFHLLAQTEKLIVPSDLKQQTVVTEPVTLRKGYLRLGTLVDYRVADRFFNSSGDKEYYNTSSWGSSAAYGITMQYGLSDRIEIDCFVEYMNKLQQAQSERLSSVTNQYETVNVKQTGLGLGDSHIEFKYQIIPEKEKKFSLTGDIRLTIPTGQKNLLNIKSENQYDLPVGDGIYALGMEISARKVIYPYSFSGYIVYTKNFNGKKIFNPVTGIEREFRTGNTIETGLSCNLHLNEWIVFGNEMNFYREGEGRIDNEPNYRLPLSWALSYEPRLIFQVHRFRLGESVRIPLKGLNTPADPLYLMMIQYVF
jgi:hypothetical protein